jgi:hypothetical protein
VVFTGTLSGQVPLTVPFPQQFVPTATGPVKVADAFSLPTAADVHLDLVVDSVGSFVCSGQAAFTVGGQRKAVSLALRVAPHDFASFAALVVGQVQAIAREVFTTLFPTAQAWLDGVAHGAISWTRSAWGDTGAVLGTWFHQSAAEVAGLLDRAAYDGGEIGRVLRAHFNTDPNGLVRAFAEGGVEVGKAARGAFVVFEQAFNRDLLTQANSVASMLRVAYAAGPVATVIQDQFSINPTWTLQILYNQRFPTADIARVADEVLGFSAKDAAQAFQLIGVPASDALQSLSAAYDTVGSQTIAGYLQAAGYARSAVNDVLSGLGLPRI